MHNGNHTSKLTVSILYGDFCSTPVRSRVSLLFLVRSDAGERVFFPDHAPIRIWRRGTRRRDRCLHSTIGSGRDRSSSRFVAAIRFHFGFLHEFFPSRILKQSLKHLFCDATLYTQKKLVLFCAPFF